MHPQLYKEHPWIRCLIRCWQTSLAANGLPNSKHIPSSGNGDHHDHNHCNCFHAQHRFDLVIKLLRISSCAPLNKTAIVITRYHHYGFVDSHGCPFLSKTITAWMSERFCG